MGGAFPRCAGGGAPREIGLIAEELAAADLEELIGRDEAGEIVGIRYSRIAVMLLAIVRQQDERIDALERALTAEPGAA